MRGCARWDQGEENDDKDDEHPWYVELDGSQRSNREWRGRNDDGRYVQEGWWKIKCGERVLFEPREGLFWVAGGEER